MFNAVSVRACRRFFNSDKIDHDLLYWRDVPVDMSLCRARSRRDATRPSGCKNAIHS